MKRVVTIVTDIEAFKAELEEKAPTYLGEDGEFLLSHLKPKKLTPNGSISYTQMKQDEYEFALTLTTLEILGDYDEVFADEVKHARYKELYPYHIPIVVEDEEGTREVYRPKHLGGFA
jgi:hypothetical protein